MKNRNIENALLWLERSSCLLKKFLQILFELRFICYALQHTLEKFEKRSKNELDNRVDEDNLYHSLSLHLRSPANRIISLFLSTRVLINALRGLGFRGGYTFSFKIWQGNGETEGYLVFIILQLSWNTDMAVIYPVNCEGKRIYLLSSEFLMKIKDAAMREERNGVSFSWWFLCGGASFSCVDFPKVRQAASMLTRGHI